MMRRVTKNAALWITLTTIVSFFIMYLMTTQYQAIEIANGLVLGAGVAIMLTWVRPAIESFGTNKGTGAGILSMAIFSLGFAVTLHRIYAYSKRWLEQPVWLEQSIFAPAAPYALFVACAMILLAPGTQEGEIPLKNYVWFVFAGMIGALVSGVAIGMSLVQLAE